MYVKAAKESELDHVDSEILPGFPDREDLNTNDTP
jgi:hypothetical protein